MKTNTLNINEVRTICQELVKTNGDCFEVAKKTSFPLELIRKIKSKEYMKSISDSYFDSNKWNPKAGVHEPERISLATTTSTPTTESTPTPKPEPTTPTPTEEPTPTEDKQLALVPDAVESDRSKPGRKKREVTQQLIDRVCEMLANGEMIHDICKVTHMTTNFVTDIKMKRKYKDVSDKYFVIKNGKLIRVSDNKIMATLHNNTAYSEEVVIDICKGIAKGLSNVDLSEKYGMSAQNISKIRTKKIYKKISDKYFTKVADGRKNSSKRTPTKPVTTLTATTDTRITTNTNTVKTTNTVSTNIIDNMIMNVLQERSISELPESLREKIMTIVSEYIDTLTVKELKELMK